MLSNEPSVTAGLDAAPVQRLPLTNAIKVAAARVLAEHRRRMDVSRAAIDATFEALRKIERIE